ncbi:MAG: cadherin-like beta sandwich domain-containing protein, partial [Sphingobacteriales bacterium]
SFVLAGADKDNYAISNTNATTTGNIEKAVLAATAENKQKVQNAVNPTFTVAITGFVTGDDVSAIQMMPVATTTVIQSTGVGTYPITVSGGTTANYTFNYISGILEIIPSADASLASVGVSVGNLSPDFDPAVFSYTAAVSNTTTSITFSPAANSNATIKINGTSLSGNPAAGTVNLAVGSNTITMEVTAQDGSIKTYTFVVTRAASADASLTALTLSTGTLSPAFASGITNYTATVGNAVTSITLIPTAANATVKVNGTSVASGSGYVSAGLVVGNNTITIVTTAQDGTTTKTYTLTVTRAASADASLASVSVNVGNLSPAFDPAVFSYTATVSNATTSITFSPAANRNATIKINGTSLSGNPAAGTVNLNVGANTITMEVTAQDGTVKTYTFVVTR